MNLTRFLICAALLVNTITIQAQNFDLFWQLESDSPGPGVPIIQPTPDGGAIFAMTNSEPITFEEFEFGIPEGQSLNLLIGKVNATGDLLWMRDLGIPSFPGSIAVDSQGNFYTHCSIFGNLTEFEIDGQTFTIGPGIIKAFMFKFDSEGNLLWGHDFNDPNNFLTFNGVGRISVDTDDNFVVIGQFSGSVFLDGVLSAEGTGFNSFYLAKGNPDGNFIWQDKIEVDIDQITAPLVAINDDNEIFVSGTWDGNTLTYGDNTLTNSLPGTFSFDNFVLKLDGDGNVIWISQESGPDSNPASIAAINNEGNIVYFREVFDELTVGEFTIDQVGLYMIEYNFEGAVEEPIYLTQGFARSFRSTPDGGFIGLYNFTEETNQIGPNDFNNYGGANGTNDLVVFKLSEQFNLEFAHHYGGVNGDMTSGGVAMLESGQILLGFDSGSPEVNIHSSTLSNPLAPLNKSFLLGIDMAFGLASNEPVLPAKIYPNPVNNELFLKPESAGKTISNLTITDIQGRAVVQQQEFSLGLVQLDLSKLKQGLYILNYEQDGKRYTGKFTVSR